MITIKKNEQAFNDYKVSMHLTEGKLISIYNALKLYSAAGSPVAKDVLIELKNALREHGLGDGL